jgi:nucleotide-binding universal stress UspA family protein
MFFEERTDRPTILVAVDLADRCRTVLDRAIGIAEAINGAIVLLHVVTTDEITARYLSVDAIERAEDARGACLGRLGALAHEADPERRYVLHDEIVDSSTVARAIVERARRYASRLIVIGTGRAGAPGSLGAVASEVVRDAPCEVLVVPTGDAQAGAADAAARRQEPRQHTPL